MFTAFFCSYETSEEILFSKTFARKVFELLKSKNADDDDFEPSETLSSTTLRKGIQFVPEYQKECKEVLNELQNSDIDLRVLNLTTNPLDVDRLIERLETIAAELPKDDILIFAIDYLQRIPSTQENIKMAIDDAMRKLRIFTQKTNSVGFLISGFNRNAYTKNNVGFSAFDIQALNILMLFLLYNF